MASKSQAVDTGKLTERDRFWLGHHEACQASGQMGKVYAKANRLSVHGFYQSAKRLRSLGALPPVATVSKRDVPARDTEVRFEKVGTLRAPVEPPPAARYRIRLPNGIQIEWAGPAEASELASVLRAVETAAQ
jgi:hypothetical protein